MTITRIGATQKYADNWEEIFGGGAKRKSAGTKVGARPVKKKKPAKQAQSAKKKVARRSKAAGGAKKSARRKK
jgi:hypothetical protein